MRLILVRHGQTNDNVRRVMQGEQGAPLNDEGWEQARRVAERFSQTPIDMLVASPIERAMQTAMTIARNHGHLHPIPMALLRERSAGETTGLSYEEFGALSVADSGGHTGFRPRGGESLRDVGRRASFWHEAMMRQWHGQTIMAVTHGGWLRAYLSWLKHGVVDTRSWKYKHDNTGVSLVDLSGTRPVVKLLNDISHLTA